MFDLFKRKKKEVDISTIAPSIPTGDPTLVSGTPGTEPPRQTPPLRRPPTPAEGWKIGQTMEVAGLGNFYIHDIKGGAGKSGMGIVYIVVDETTMTPFAIKTFQQWCLDSPGLVQRFQREAETWIKLEQHQNIVRAFYVASIQEQPHIFLEYVAGSDLRKKLVAGSLPIPDALRYSIQFCRGMVHARSKVPGLVHRDIKPENCMFTPDDTLRVTDFGLVKVLAGTEMTPQAAPGEKLSETHSRLFKTKEGEMGVGTLPYMAPEQFTDFAHVDVRADVYSFGTMLFEMLTGRRPFMARGAEQWFHQHVKATPPDPQSLNPEISPALSRIALRCLAKKPEERFADFAALEKDLADVLRNEFQADVPRAAPQELEAWDILNKGAALGNLGRNREALACFDKSLEILPGVDGAWLNKGVILARLGRTQEAVDCYEKALEINPKSSYTWYNRGLVHGNLGAVEQALQCYEKAIEINPRYDAAWLNKGVALRKLGRIEEALTCYDRALALNPQSSVAWHNKGVALRKLGHLREELQCFENALAINPRYADAWLNRGVALRKSNRLIEALACYDRALDIRPRYADAWYNKGVVLRKMGQTRESRDAFQHAAALNPSIAEQLK